jgi:hypothetical protein
MMEFDERPVRWWKFNPPRTLSLEEITEVLKIISFRVDDELHGKLSERLQDFFTPINDLQ